MLQPAGDPPVETPKALQPVTRPDEQLLLLEMRLGQYVVSDGIPGYYDNGGLLLPLAEVARILEFPIAVDPANGRADGWYVNEKKLFALDLSHGIVVLEGKRWKFNTSLVELHRDDIYVDSRLLGTWFPIDINFDLSNLLVTLRSREPLAMEQRLGRDQRRALAVARRNVRQEEYQRIDVPYQWVDWPFVNVSADAGSSRNATGDVASSARYNMLASADLLKMSSTLFVAGDQSQGVSQVRFAMGREDPDGELMGPLGVTSYSFGDVATQPVDMVANSRFGRGAEISSFPLEQSGEFDTTTLIGELPLGWDIELYRNESLLDFQSSRGDGRYEFNDVPLLFGLNILRLEFFGPQGQRRTEIRRVIVGPGQIPPGKANFRITANQQDEYLIPLDNTDTLSVTDQQLQGEPRATAEVEYGVSKSISVAGAAITVPLPDGRHQYGMLGLRAGWGGVYGRLDMIGDSAGGSAGKLGMQFYLPLNLGLMLEHAVLTDFMSEDFPDTLDPTASVSRARLDGVIPVGPVLRVPFSVGGRHEIRESGATDTRVTNRISTAISRLSLSNSLEWHKTDNLIVSSETATGDLLVGGRIGQAWLRGTLRYEIEPESRMTMAGAQAEMNFGNYLSTRIGVQRELIAPERTTLLAGLSRRFDVLALGLNGSWADDGSWGAFMSLSFSFGREPRSGDWYMDSRAGAERGAASMRVFLDRDLNGVYSEGDEPLPDVTLGMGQALATRDTNADGVAFVTGLPPYQDLDVTLPANALEDPYWLAEKDGVTVRPRPGVAAVADFPVVVTGEVDGTARLRDGNGIFEIADVSIQLVDEQGRVVDEAKSAYDGFFLFEFVRPGRYTVRVAPEQLVRLGFAVSAEREIEIDADGTIASGIDFVLQSPSGI